MDTETLNNVLFVIRLGLVTILLWLLSRVFDLWQTARAKAADRDAYIQAIYAEIAFNTFDMGRFLQAEVPIEKIEALFENSSFIPHITDARHTEVYASRIGELHFVAGEGHQNTSLVGKLVRLYGELEKVTQQIEGLSKASFQTISPKGKTNTVKRIYKTCGVCQMLGEDILSEMELTFAHLNFSRIDRDDTKASVYSLNREELSSRLRELSSNLDRVNKK